jgi:ATP-dependent helicase/nuclease subunit B
MLNSKIIIAPSSIHQSLMTQMLDNQQAVVGVSLVTFNTFLQTLSETQPSKYLTFAQSYQTIQDIKSQCHSIRDSLGFPAIVKDMINFTQSLIELSIDVNKLPRNTKKEKDIALCIESITPLLKDMPSIASIKNRLTSAHHIEIYPFLMNPFEKNVVDYLISIGATYKPLQVSTSKSQKVYYALNHAHEAEALAQHILEHQDDTTLIISCDTSVLPDLIKSTFSRYQIPFSSDLDNSRPIIISQFLSLLRLLTNPSIHLFKECVHNHVFDLTDVTSFLEYIELLDIDFDDLFSPFAVIKSQIQWHTLDNRDIQKLNKLEEAAETQRMMFVPFFESLTDDHIVDAFNYFSKQFNQLDNHNQEALHQIKSIIEDVSTLKLEDDDFQLIIDYLISNTTVSTTINPGHIHLTGHHNITHLNYEKTIIIGANQHNYPGFSKQNGIIDESYLRLIPYPTLNERLDLYIQQLHSLTTLSSTLIVSYATSTFEGKSMAPAHDLIQQLDQSPKKWSINLYGQQYEREYTMSPDIAQDIFFKKNELFGSVSSFEVFFNCPYHYFLRTGLKLRDHHSTLNMPALMGTIVHAIVEKLIKVDPKTYSNQSIEELSIIVQPYFDDLKTLMPKKVNVWNFVSDLLANNLWLMFKRLNDMEQDTNFTFYKAELKFNHDFQLNNDIMLKLQGFIDRIDQNSEFFRIVDYKSSYKNLSLSKVKAGLQLQLLTYLVVADKLLDKKPSGAFYFSFLNQTVDISQQRLVSNKIISQDTDDYYNLFIKAHKLSGWFVNDDASMYYSNKFVKHISKYSKVNKPGLFDFETITEFLVHLYTYLSQELKQGMIDRTPVEGACDYCEFRHICIFKDRFRKLEDLGEEFGKLKGT